MKFSPRSFRKISLFFLLLPCHSSIVLSVARFDRSVLSPPLSHATRARRYVTVTTLHPTGRRVSSLPYDSFPSSFRSRVLPPKGEPFYLTFSSSIPAVLGERSTGRDTATDLLTPLPSHHSHVPTNFRQKVIADLLAVEVVGRSSQLSKVISLRFCVKQNGRTKGSTIPVNEQDRARDREVEYREYNFGWDAPFFYRIPSEHDRVNLDLADNLALVWLKHGLHESIGVRIANEKRFVTVTKERSSGGTTTR